MRLGWVKTWTVAGLAGDRCGYDGGPIQADEPMQLIGHPEWPSTKRLRRCLHHAVGPVDWSQIESERQRLEAERQRQAPDTLANTRPTYRHVPRRLKSFREIAGATPFDPKTAAAGDRGDD